MRNLSNLIIISSIITFCPTWAISQYLSGFVESCYSSYSMQNLNNWQSSININSPIIFTSKTKFNNSNIYNSEISYRNENIIFGALIGYSSTESTWEYQTIQGPGKFNMNLAFLNTGISIGVTAVKNRFIILSPNVRFLAVFNKLNFEGLSVNSKNFTEARSLNFGFGPGISLENSFQRFLVRLRVGIEFQIAGRLHLPNDRSQYLTNLIDTNALRRSEGVV